MDINNDEWLSAALDAESTQLATLISSLPHSSSQSVSASLAQGSALDSRVYALRSVSQDHSVGGNPKTAAMLATVGISFCKHCYKQYGPGTANTFVFGVGQFAMDAHRAYDRMDNHKEQVTVLENNITWLNAHEGAEHHLVDLRIALIEALITQGRLEEANEKLNAEAAAGNANHPSFSFLEQRIQSRLVSATERKDERSVEEQAADQRQQTLKSALQGLSSLSPEFTNIFKTLGAQVDEQSEVLSKSDSIAKDSNMYQTLGAFMENMAGGSGNQFSLNVAIQKASAVLADPQRGYDPTNLDQVRESLEATRQEAIDTGLENTAADTLWPLHICYKRMERYDASLDILQTIRPLISKSRELIQDPLKRAGIAKQYPHLYVELCPRLIDRGDSAELLSVIEEAKGRALTDLLAIEAHREGLLNAPKIIANWLPKLMTKLNSHYITFLMDEDVSYGVCVTKKGELYSARLPIGSRLIEELRNDIDPSNWGKKTRGFFASPNDVAQQLSPLVNWLEELVSDGALREGDHVCYSPDGLLHLVPLHYVDFHGAPLVKLVSLSRTHSASLLHYFAQQPVSHPTHYVSMKVPLASEAENDHDKVSELGRAPDWLDSGPIPGYRLDDEKADLKALLSQDLTHAVIHFATHGYFPKPEEAIEPFRGAGLVISKDGHLPQDAQQCGLLSPKCIIERDSQLNLDHSHVSLQACVSGLSEEGIGGDALGLEWSLLIAGASSVLSTHWNIPVESSADFCIRFYEEWLVNGLSRAQAWRNVILSQLDNSKAFDNKLVYNWAPFSLAGDWR